MILIWLAFFVTYLVCAALVIPRATFQRYRATPRDWQHAAAHILFYSIPASFPWADDPGALAVFVSCGLFILGGGLVIYAVASNPWFSPAIEMPPMVITGGVYRLKHPAYIGFFLMAFASWLMVGAIWTLIPLVLYAALLTWRAWRESRLLYGR